MDPKTRAALNSITPQYSSGHRQTVPVDDEEHIQDAPPSYEASTSTTQAHHATIPTPSTSTRPGTASTSSCSSVGSREPLQLGDRQQYTSHRPMYVFRLDDKTKETLERSPGCCFSTRGGCCFSDMGGCCFSSNAGCCFSSNAGCCFSDHAGFFFSDNGGACCSNHGGVCCADPGPDMCITAEGDRRIGHQGDREASSRIQGVAQRVKAFHHNFEASVTPVRHLGTS